MEVRLGTGRKYVVWFEKRLGLLAFGWMEERLALLDIVSSLGSETLGELNICLCGDLFLDLSAKCCLIEPE